MKFISANPNIFVMALLSLALLSKPCSAEESLTLGIHPFLSENELITKFKPLADYLGQSVGLKINVRVGSNYQEHIQYIGSDKIDIAYMGPASYVHLTAQYGIKPVLARLEVNGHPYFQGNIIVRGDSEITSLKDLKGKKIAFGDPNSTMSYILPHHMLHAAGVFKETSTKHQFLHSHNNVALGVLTGDFDAGAVKPAVFKKFENKGLRTIALTSKVSEHLFITRSDLSDDKKQALRKTMLNMKKSTEGLAALHAIKKSITGLVSANSNDYDNLRKIISESKLIHPN